MCMRMRMRTKFSLSLSALASLAEALLLLLPSRSARRSARSRRACCTSKASQLRTAARDAPAQRARDAPAPPSA